MTVATLIKLLQRHDPAAFVAIERRDGGCRLLKSVSYPDTPCYTDVDIPKPLAADHLAAPKSFTGDCPEVVVLRAIYPWDGDADIERNNQAPEVGEFECWDTIDRRIVSAYQSTDNAAKAQRFADLHGLRVSNQSTYKSLGTSTTFVRPGNEDEEFYVVGAEDWLVFGEHLEKMHASEDTFLPGRCILENEEFHDRFRPLLK